MIIWALYGRKVSGRNFWHHLRSFMKYLGFESCLVDPNVWTRASTRADGTKYYEYILLYVDNFLVTSDKSKGLLRKEIGQYFELEGSQLVHHPYVWVVKCVKLCYKWIQGVGLWICTIR